MEWETKFANAARKCFNTDEDNCLALITENKQLALHRKSSFDWNRLHIDMITYLDNVSDDKWRETFVPLLEGIMTAQGKQLATAFGAQFDVQNLAALQWFDEYTLAALQWFDEYTLTFATDIVETTKTGISDLLQQAQYEGWTVSQMQDNLGLMFKQWRDGTTNSDEWEFYDQRMPAYRLENIARTETMRASNYGNSQIMKEAGVEKKEWLATNDDRVRDAHMVAWQTYSGASGAILLDAPFIVDDEELQYPGDPNGSPGNVCNCRCTCIPFFANAAHENIAPTDEELAEDE